ncbi:DUF3791 domain-containing protein [Anaerovorax odorimutans]
MKFEILHTTGKKYIVEDIGRCIKTRKIDVYFEKMC